MRQVLIPRSELAYVLSLSETRVAELVKNGTLPQALGRGKFDLHSSVRAYLAFLRSHTKGSLTEEKTRLTRAKADKEELLLRVRGLELIEVSTVRQRTFELARSVRDALLNVPDRLAGPLAAEGDQSKVHAVLTKELHQALEALAHGR